MLGATKFFFYGVSMSDTSWGWLKAYEAEGHVEVVPWPDIPPLGPDPDLLPSHSYYRFGLVAAINDCLLRFPGLVPRLLKQPLTWAGRRGGSST